MNISVHNRIRILIEETNDAFSSCGSINADFAEFATLALSDFKHLLSSPGLTDAQLKAMLRKGMTKYRDKDPGSWAAFMAHHLTRAANINRSRLGADGT